MDELSQIRQKIDIVTFISEYLPLKKAGRNFRVTCPFHGERTPSFIVSPERQIFHCFGCGVGGDIFTFLMKYENLEFPEALRILAQRAGVELKKRPFDTKLSKNKEKLYEINHLASEFYHYLLISHPSGKPALSYLKNRGISEGAIKTFKLGFVPNLRDALIKFLLKKKYLLSELSEAGLVIKGERDYIDKFRNRIIFPLEDHRGNIVGFSGRILTEGSEIAKYMNTPETLIYHKGDLLYGLVQNKGEIKKEDRVIVVEGEFDVIQSFQEGVRNVVAIKGTALTPNQASLIGRFTENISLCLDQDSAGELANKKSIEILEEAGFQIGIIKLPAGKDPDENLRKNPALFKRAIKNPMPIYDFILESAVSHFDPKEVSGKKKISNEVIPFLAKIQNEIIKNHYLKKLAQVLEVSEEAILKEINKIERTSPPSAVDSLSGQAAKKDREEVLMEYLLALFIQSPTPKTFLPQIRKILEENLLKSPLYQKIFQKLEEFLQKEKFSIQKFVDCVLSELVPAIDRSFLLFLPPDLSEEGYLLEVEKTIKNLKVLLLRKKMQEAGKKIKIAEGTENERELTLLKENFGKLTTELSSHQS